MPPVVSIIRVMLKIVFALPPCLSSLPLPAFSSHISTLFFASHGAPEAVPSSLRPLLLLAAFPPCFFLPSAAAGAVATASHRPRLSSLANNPTAQHPNSTIRCNVATYYKHDPSFPSLLASHKSTLLLARLSFSWQPFTSRPPLFLWAAASWLLWSSGGGILVTMVVGRRHRGYYVEPFTKAALHSLLPSRPPYLLPSRPKKRCPLALPTTSSHHSFCSFPSRSSWLRWSGGGAFLLCLYLRLASLGCWQTHVHSFMKGNALPSVYVAPMSTYIYLPR